MALTKKGDWNRWATDNSH